MRRGHDDAVVHEVGQSECEEKPEVGNDEARRVWEYPADDAQSDEMREKQSEAQPADELEPRMAE